GGFVPVLRADLGGEIGADAALLGVWIRLNEWAAWAPQQRRFGGRLWQLAAGQLPTSVAALARSLALTPKVVGARLRRLVELGRVALKTSPEGTLVTLLA